MEKTERERMITWTAGIAVVGLALLALVLAELREGGSHILLAVALVAAALAASAIAVLAGTVWSGVEQLCQQRHDDSRALHEDAQQIRGQLRAANQEQGRHAFAAEEVVRVIEWGALSWGAGAAKGTERVRVEYEDQAWDQLGTTVPRRRVTMRLIQSGLDLLSDEIRRGTTLEVGLRLDGSTVQVLSAGDDVVIAIRASGRAYVVVYGRSSEDWHAFAVTQLEPLTKEHAQQRGIALG
jgi:hypothetical protein